MKLIAYICFLIRRISEKGKSYSPMLIVLGSVIILTISLSAVIMSYFINNANSNFLLMFSGLKSIYYGLDFFIIRMPYIVLSVTI